MVLTSGMVIRAFQTLPNPPWKAIRNMVFWKALEWKDKENMNILSIS